METTSTKRQLFCQIHEGKQVLFSCKHDGDLLCEDCVINHNSHEDKILNLDLDKLLALCDDVINNFPKIKETINQNLDNIQSKEQLNQEDVTSILQIADFYQKINNEDLAQEQLKKLLKSSIKKFFPSYKPNLSVFQTSAVIKNEEQSLDSLLITNPEQIQLIKDWIGYDCSLKLLFRGSKSGFKSQKFHFMCDNKGATLTVFKVGTNFIFGGFSNVKQHTPNGQYPVFEKDPNAFLFQLFPHKTKHPLIKNPEKAVGRSHYHLACFGKTEREPQEIADLEVCAGITEAGKGGCNLGNNYYLPESLAYGSIDAKKYLAGQANFVVNEMEVFQVKKKTTTAKSSE